MQLRPGLNRIKACYDHVFSTPYFGFPPKSNFWLKINEYFKMFLDLVFANFTAVIHCMHEYGAWKMAKIPCSIKKKNSPKPQVCQAMYKSHKSTKELHEKKFVNFKPLLQLWEKVFDCRISIEVAI